MDKAIVIGCGVAGWAILRSLAGVPRIHRIALSASSAEMAWASRYAHERWLCPHPQEREAEFVRFLQAQGRAWEGALLIPAGDFMAASLSRHHEELSKMYRVAMGPWEVVRRLFFKDELALLAQQAEVPMPRSVRIRAGEMTFPKDVAGLQYPVWIKPVASAQFVRQFGVKGYQARDRAELEFHLTRLRSAGQPLLIQEVIPGEDHLLELVSFYIGRDGRVWATSARRKVRQHPPSFGVMRVGYSVDQLSEAEALSWRLLRQAGGYQGLVSFEFKRDPRDAKLKLIEANVRMARSGMLATASGVNFPQLMYADLVCGMLPSAVRSKPGVWWIELIPDLYYTFLHPEGRRYTWAQKLQPYRAPAKVFGDFDLRDFRPFVRQWMRALPWRWKHGGLIV
ncbi:MAG: hypothetical protein RMN51_12420 [Verrucomicrobiota bacterium]|nr:hypothetical protein [Limisphaera sp.]MDW8382897.1 hypothetical protein [Verrucomicrobiota bacterium]